VDDGVRVELDAARAPELARALVAAGADVAELRPRDRSLEEVFFDLTGDGATDTDTDTDTAALEEAVR
jgi:ABC-2 type transport system ATP-binding protein